MKLSPFLFSAVFIFIGSAAVAGHGDSMGNGGTVMVCSDHNNNEHLTTYDIYEGQVLRGLQPQMGSATLDYLQKVEMVLARIPQSNAEFRDELEQNFVEFQNQFMIGDFDVLPIDDTGELVIAPGCHLQQAAVQRTPATSTDKRYFLDKKIWDQLDNDSKAALVLHEIIYRMTIMQGQTTSVGARTLNSYLMDGRMLSQQPCLVTSLLEDLHLSTMDFFQFGDLQLLATSSIITPSCQVREAVVVDGFVLVHKQKIFPAMSSSTKMTASVSFNDNGSLQRILIDREQDLKVGAALYQLALGADGLGELQFDQDGNLTQAMVRNIDTIVNGQNIRASTGVVFFAADGSVIGVSSREDGFATVIDGISFEKIWRLDTLENNGLRLWVPHDVLLSTSQADLRLAGLFFFSSEKTLQEASLSQPTVLKLEQQTCLAAATNIQFYPHHLIRQFVAANACALTMASGQSQQVQANDIVVVDENGRVIQTSR